MDQRNYGRKNLICRSRRMLSALVDNTNWRWFSLIYITSHNSWMTWGSILWRIKHKVSYHTKAESNNCFTIHSKYFQAENMHASSCYVNLCVKVLAFKTFATLSVGEGWPFFSAHRSQSGYDGMFIVADSLHIITVFVFRAVFFPFSDVLSLRE